MCIVKNEYTILKTIAIAGRFFRLNITTKRLQEFRERIFINDFQQSSEIICYEHQSHISTGSFHPLFGSDVIKSPLINLLPTLNCLLVLIYIGKLHIHFINSGSIKSY